MGKDDRQRIVDEINVLMKNENEGELKMYLELLKQLVKTFK